MKHHQRGTAVFTALFVVVVASAIAVALMVQQRIDVRRTEQVITNLQSMQYAQGVLYWAEALLTRFSPTSEQQWPLRLPATLIAGQQGLIAGKNSNARSGLVAGEISDASRLVNLNRVLQDPKPLTQLLQNLPQRLDQAQAQTLVRELTHWVSSKQPDNFDEKYLAKQPPYLSAQRYLVSATELRLISGFTSQIVAGLMPNVIAYNPDVTAAPPATPTDAEAAEAQNQAPAPDAAPAPVTTESRVQHGPFYLLRTDVKLGSQQLTLYTLLHRLTVRGKVQVQMVWQSRGTL